MKYLGHFAHFFFRNLFYFPMLSFAFLRVMFGVTPGGQVTAEPHRDRPGGDLSETCRHDDAGAVDGPGQSRRERKRNRQPIGHANHDVTNGFAGGEVSFNVSRLWHWGSVSEARA